MGVTRSIDKKLSKRNKTKSYSSPFHGRINRATYIMAHVLGAFLFLGLYYFVRIYLVDVQQNVISISLDKVIRIIVFIVVAIIYRIAICLKRAHDFNHGFWPGQWDWEYLWVEGDTGPNKYGPPPKPGIDWLALVKFW